MTGKGLRCASMGQLDGIPLYGLAIPDKELDRGKAVIFAAIVLGFSATAYVRHDEEHRVSFTGCGECDEAALNRLIAEALPRPEGGGQP